MCTVRLSSEAVISVQGLSDALVSSLPICPDACGGAEPLTGVALMSLPLSLLLKVLVSRNPPHRPPIPTPHYRAALDQQCT